MAILTFNSTPDRGVAAIVTLNKTELSLISSVAGDSYYSDINEWAYVTVLYRSDISGQREILTFDATEATPEATFIVSAKSRGNFLVEVITIKDGDDGYIQVKRDELNTGEFDILLA